jgi:hypothetical protein
MGRPEVPTYWGSNVTLDGVRLTIGPRIAVPVRPTACGLPDASLVLATVPLLVPTAVGVKVTLIVQLAPARTFVPQVFAWAKSPLATMLVMARDRLPLFVRVTGCAGLVVPTRWVAKLKLEGERATTGAKMPVPVRVTT